MSETTATADGGPSGRGYRPDGLAEGIARLRRAMRRGARVADPENPLAVAQLELLSAVTEYPGARPGQLARQLHMRPNTVTTIVNALTARGMISRAAAGGDRRAVELTATGTGQKAVNAWQATNAAVLNLALSTLPEAQQRALTAAVPALGALARAIDQMTDQSPSPPRDRR
jgi:DNA-binding MarR family transcriptional regulator